jgi:ATP-dependent DNA helicase DinG
MNEESILACFPARFAPRPQQIKVLNDIEKAITRGKKYIVIQAPTGVGKSVISYTVLRWSDNGYVCTGTKTLQEQYLTEYEELLTVKGRSNFECLEREDGMTCDKGKCQILEMNCERKPSLKISHFLAYYSERDGHTKYWTGPPGQPVRCPYWKQKADALNNFAVAPNYDYILSESNYVGEFRQRKVLISDEGHNVETKIIYFIKVPISKDVLDIINK